MCRIIGFFSPGTPIFISVALDKGDVNYKQFQLYLVNGARISRKITGKSSSFVLVPVLWWFEHFGDHSEPIPRRSIDFKKVAIFSKISVLSGSSFVFVLICTLFGTLKKDKTIWCMLL